MQSSFQIHAKQQQHYQALGELTVTCYQQLRGMPSQQQQPDYYAMLLNVSSRAQQPNIEIFTATNDQDELLGGVTFAKEMAQYGSGGSAGQIINAAGMRLLVTRPEARGQGIGRALTQHCIEYAQALGKTQLILHTTDAMPAARHLYQQLGFQRYPQIDFMQQALPVYGYSRQLA